MPNFRQVKNRNNYILRLETYYDGKRNSKKWDHVVHLNCTK